MPSIDEILESIKGGSVKDIINVENRQEQEHIASENILNDVPDCEKLARELDKIISEDSQDPIIETPIYDNSEQMKKMAVAATILDTLQGLDVSGESDRSFKKYFREIKHGQK